MIKITQKEFELLEAIKEICFGEAILVIHNGNPLKLKDIKKDIVFKGDSKKVIEAEIKECNEVIND